MIKLLQDTFQTLSSNVGIPIYLERAPKDINGNPVQPPYAVFNYVPSSNVEKDRQDNMLEVNVWDLDGGDTTKLETNTEQLNQALKDLRITNENHLLIFVQTGPPAMIPDPVYRRRELRYEVRQYGR